MFSQTVKKWCATSMYVRTVRMHECARVCVRACAQVWTYEGTNACMYARMYACAYVWMSVSLAV